jgi:hypothetical protein
MTPPPDNSEFAPLTMGAFRAGVAGLEKGLAHVEGEWQAVNQAIQRLLQRVERELDKLFTKTSLWERITDNIKDLVKRIRHLLKQIGEKVEQLLAALREAIANSVPVASLFEIGLNWASKVNPILSDLGNDMPYSGKINSWEGPAKETYKERVLDQIAAVDSTTEKVKATSLWLADVAKMNTDYMVKLGGRAIAVIAQAVILAIDTAETVEGAVTQVVVALADLSQLIGTVVQQVMEYQVELASRLAEVVKQITSIATEVGDRRGLPDGKWPAAVSVEA